MTNAPESRQTHIIRLVGTNKAGDVLQDIWIDLERFEVAKSATKTAQGFWQGVQRQLQWQDDPDADDFLDDGNAARNPSDDDIVKVCSPDEADVNDPEEWVPVRRIKSMKSRGGSAGDQNYQDRFLNDETVESRKVTVRRIVHYDTNIDDAAQAAFDADPTRKAYVVKGADYTRKDGSDGSDTTKDEAQYVEHEIIEFFKPRTNERDDIVGQVNRNVQVKMLNQYLIDESDEPDHKVVGNNGINPPYRHDPWQNIVNVKFSQTVIVVFVDFAATVPRILSTFSIINDSGGNPKAELLDQFDLDPVDNVNTRSKAYCYKVSAGAGEFIRTTGASVPGNGQDLLALVFAIIPGDIETSLNRAKAGARLVVSSAYLETHGSNELPAQVDPPGLLWSVGAETVPPGWSITWKIKQQKHRIDPPHTSLPNSMVQCYPLTTAYTSLGVVTGYQIRVYRLDRKGTGQSYGGDLDPAALLIAGGDPAAPGSQMDPVWRQVIGPGNGAAADGKFRGIPFGDPPPLITNDNPSV